MAESHDKNDLRLVEACLQKDLAAWANLVKKYSPLVYISIENRLKKYGISASHHDLEDIRQNIFADIWRCNKLEAVINRNDISYWISILSGNAAIEYFRGTSARQAQKTVSIFEKIDERELSEILPSQNLSPKDELAKAEIKVRVEEAIELLPDREKLMVKLHFIYDKKYHEIADILGVPAGTVSSYIKRAKEKLKKSCNNF